MALPIRSRIAPTPSGFLHLGNAFNFQLTASLTRQFQGQLLLRIDDLDAPRIRTEYLQDIFESLDWLGIRIDAGPRNMDEQLQQYAQQFRLANYQELLDKLVIEKRVFGCDCSRKEIQAVSPEGHYPGTCRDKHLPLDTPDITWRFRTEANDLVNWRDGILGLQEVSVQEVNPDFIIRRRDGLPAYHIASLSDDISYGINLIVRGEDLRESTAAQLLLASTLKLDAFLNARFYHHPLLVDAQGNKLSKSKEANSLMSLRSGMSGGK